MTTLRNTRARKLVHQVVQPVCGFLNYFYAAAKFYLALPFLLTHCDDTSGFVDSCPISVWERADSVHF